MATFLESVRVAIHELLNGSKDAYLIGEDVVDPYGGAFKVSKGLSRRFPTQVIASPISEAAIVGYGIGRAIKGHPGLVEIMFGDFLTLAFDQIINQGLKVQEMYGQKIKLPLVIRFPTGGYRGYGPTHSQSLESVFLAFPELPVICPSVFDDPGFCLKRLFELNRICLFAEHKMLYQLETSPSHEDGIPLYIESFGDITFRKSIIKISQNKEKISDCLIISYGYLSSVATKAMVAAYLNEEIVSAVISCCSLGDHDFLRFWQIICNAKKIIIVQEFPVQRGWAVLVEASIYKLFASHSILPPTIVQLGARGSTIPSAMKLELDYLPSKERITEAISCENH